MFEDIKDVSTEHKKFRKFLQTKNDFYRRIKKDYDNTTKNLRPPMSAFTIFSNRYRDQIKEEEPELRICQIGKRLRQLWKQLHDSDKIPFKEEAKQYLVKHQQKMAEWEGRHLDEDSPIRWVSMNKQTSKKEKLKNKSHKKRR